MTGSTTIINAHNVPSERLVQTDTFINFENKASCVPTERYEYNTHFPTDHASRWDAKTFRTFKYKIKPMANTYTQLHIQLVFAVKYRAALIQKTWRPRLHEYITGIFQRNEHKMLQINSTPDHIHILIGMRPYQSISTLIQNVKTESTKWINENKFCKSSFAWQEGFGAFSYSKSHVPDVIRYIQNQEVHHKKQTFLDEYRHMLKAFEIDYDERYIFKDAE